MGAQLWNIEKMVKKGDYIYAIVKEHPKATRHGYVLLHRIVMENHLGRLLNNNEIIHHLNGLKKDNRIENLSLSNLSIHARDHTRERGRKLVILKCPFCKTIFERRLGNTHLEPSRNSEYSTCSHKCKGQFSMMIKLHGKTQLVESAISENILRVFRRFPDNSEETITMDSVETIRIQPEMVKI